MDVSRITRWHVPGLLIGSLLAGAVAAADGPPKKMEPGKFITQQQLRERGSLKIDIPEVGRFELRRIAVRSDPRQECAVEIASLKSGIREAVRRGGGHLEPGTSLKVSFEKTGCVGPNGEVLLCCMGDGNGCTADLGVLARD